jgi:hypothetical protein
MMHVSMKFPFGRAFSFVVAGFWAIAYVSLAIADDSPAKPPAPRLTDDLAGRVEDGRPLPDVDWTDPPEEAKAYCLALRTALATDGETLAKTARRDVTYAQLFNDPAKYRGEIIHVTGRLKRITAFDPPKLMTGEVPAIYECWLFDPEHLGENPICAVVAELPANLKPSADLNAPVSIDGYFFKRYRYKAQDGWRDAPLLIGRSLTVRTPNGAADQSEEFGRISRSLIWGITLLFAGTIGVLLAVAWWYRRGDARVARMLADARPPQLPEPDQSVASPEYDTPHRNGS